VAGVSSEILEDLWQLMMGVEGMEEAVGSMSEMVGLILALIGWRCRESTRCGRYGSGGCGH
jgi:hypothetical protein